MDIRYVKIDVDTCQRQLLHSNLGREVNTIIMDTQTGVAFPEDIECTRCLMSTRFNHINISASGLCNVCEEYENHADTQKGEEDALRFFGSNNDSRVLIAFSGGKDSAASLVIAVEEFGLDPTVLLVDNGFIPEHIVKRAQELCDSLRVRLVVRKIGISKRVKQSILNYWISPPPCQICITKVFEEVASMCRQLNINKVISGHRYPPFTYTLDNFTGRRRDASISCISLLMAKGIKEEQQLDLLDKYGFKNYKVPGNSTNCMLLGYVEDIFFNRFGYSPNIQEVSKEIRAGFITREEGLEKIKKPLLTKQLKAKVAGRLSL